MSILFDHIWRLLLMVGLLICSGFFSASETGFFNLSRRQLDVFGHSDNRLHILVARLMNNPERLLSTLLFCNTTVNTLFFSLASVLSLQLGRTMNTAAGGISAILEFFVLVLFGEMLPKSVAYSNSRRVCLFAAPICYVLMRILHPILQISEGLLIRPALRLCLGAHPSRTANREISPHSIRMILEPSCQQGLITEAQSRLVTEVLQFGLLKLRHIMRPRVDMIMCEINGSIPAIQTLMKDRGLTRIPVYETSMDNVIGVLDLRDLLLHSQEKLRSIVHPVDFIPEQKTVESMFEYFSRHSSDLAIVVDEYGGVTGMISMDILLDELLGEPKANESILPVEQIGPMRYRLAGYLPIHDWAETFGVDPAEYRFATVAGLLIGQLGKIPRPGDSILMKNIRLSVDRMDRHRVRTVVMSLEPILENKSASEEP
jgi:putative hemolysin